MGKITGFIDFQRKNATSSEPLERIKHYQDFHQPLCPQEQMKQASRCMDCGVAFCQSNEEIKGMMSGCPLQNLIPEFNDLLSMGLWKHAYQRLVKTNNFPEFTSRVCPALCEVACTCGLNQEAVSTKENEHSIIEKAYLEGWVDSLVSKYKTGKKIAIIGSGPSGLAAADQLIKRGHEVCVYEKSDRLGGLLMYGIPNMKLEKSVIDRRIEVMKQAGVIFKVNSEVGKGIDSADLLDSYDAIILACGASVPRNIQVSGREATGIHYAVDFLSATTKCLLENQFENNGLIDAYDKDVVIIGGGDTGNDCVATALRHGCKSVTQLEMMAMPPIERAANNPWPQWPKVLKTDYGQQEAIGVYGKDPRLFQTTVKSFIQDENHQLKAVEIVSVHFEKDEVSQRMMMKIVEESERILPCDLVLIAAGFTGADPRLAEQFNVIINERGNIATKKNSYQTQQDKIYVAGDMRRGQSLVVWAIREGREVAAQVDNDLMSIY